MKNNRGITLIALVITIIVLLILAGVSIAMVTGDNGLLGQATRAGAETQVAEAKEMAIMDVSTLVAQYYEERYVNKQSSGQTGTNASTYVKNNLEDKDPYYTFDDATGVITLKPLNNEGKKTTGTITGNDAVINWAVEQ